MFVTFLVFFYIYILLHHVRSFLNIFQLFTTIVGYSNVDTVNSEFFARILFS